MRKGRKCGSNWGWYHFLFEKKIAKRSVQCHVFTQSPPGRHPSEPFALFQICVKRFHWQYYLVAAVIHIQYLRSQMCVYAHIIRNIEMPIG
jgi:hypothetical protein